MLGLGRGRVNEGGTDVRCNTEIPNRVARLGCSLVKDKATPKYPTGDKFTDSYIETALWCFTNDSTPSGWFPRLG
jgi:hypothetical protein